MTEPRAIRPGLSEAARTVGFYGSFAATAGLGAGLATMNRSRSTLLEITGGAGSDIALAIAGVEVAIVAGEEHLWSARPCVFVFNHQSNIDAIVLMKVLRRGYTAVAKAEARSIPGFGQFFQLVGVAFVERGNRDQALEALKPAVAKVRDEGLCLVISPEGTRSSTPSLGRFKKGAFHIAMQAGVPMVPIVLRHTGDVLPRGAKVIRGGPVEVEVLPPIDTRTWTVESLDQHVADVRDKMEAALAGSGEPSDTPGVLR